ncbi:uncharacterized mitochondrial protein-like protein [Tanacetum coccineum]
MQTFYQPHPREYQWTKDHPLEQVIGDPSRPVLTRNQLRTDGDMCIYALTMSTMEPRNIKEAMTDPAWIDSMQEELLQFKKLDVWVLVPTLDNIKPLTLKWLFKNKLDEENTSLETRLPCLQAKEGTLWVKASTEGMVYVDDIIFSSTNPRYTQLFVDLMKSCFEMSMIGEMMFFLSLQVNQSPCGIFINQSNYVLEILKKYGMETCDPIGTPMEIKDKLDLDKNGTLVDATKYHSMIGALMYLTSSRPDIVHATCLCARYQAQPTEKHLKEVKRIFCYLRGTVNMGLWYTKNFSFELTGFSDADYAGCRDSNSILKRKAGGLVLEKARLYDAVIRGSIICVFIRLLCPSHLDADTVNGLWLSLQQDSYLLGLYGDIENSQCVINDFSNTLIDFSIVLWLQWKYSKTNQLLLFAEIQRFKDLKIQDKIKAKDQDIRILSKDIKLKIKIQDHRHAERSSKEFSRTQGSKTQDVTRSEAISAMTTP